MMTICLPVSGKIRLPDGPNKGRTVDVRPAVQQYYMARGWDSAGVPSNEILSELGLKGDA